MPYTVSNPPAAIKGKMPKHGIEIYVASFNSAWDGTCADRSDREGCAAAIAYSAVKSAGYSKGDDGKWHLKRAAQRATSGVLSAKDGPMSKIRQLFSDLANAIESAINTAVLPEPGAPDAPGRIVGTAHPGKARVIAAQQLFGKVFELLSEINGAARQIDEYGMVSMDPEVYLSPMDIYYDDDGSLFVLCTRGGKLLRLPVEVSGEDVTLGEPVEISLTGRAQQSSFRVVRTADGTRRWVGIAASSVLNRVNEIDSNALFDSFIAHAERTGDYPILSFYHQPSSIRFGVAEFLARAENLYLAAGVFDDTEIGRAAADGLERSPEPWGMSIGYVPTADPELFEIQEGIRIPVYQAGINTEISTVLEREAAAHFTTIGTGEVQRIMEKKVYERLVALIGKEAADALAAQTDETNRTIETEGLIHRAEAQTVAPAAEASAPPAQSAAPATVATADAPAAAPAETAPAQERTDTAQEFEIPEELFGALAEALAARFQPMLDAVNTAVAGITPRLDALETAQQTAAQDAQTRLAQLERSEADKQREWIADLPAPQRTVVTLRPRDVRGAQAVAEGSTLDTNAVANQTLARMKTRQPQA